MRHRRLAVVAWVGVYLPVLMHGMTTEENRADDGNICGADEDVGDLDPKFHVDQTGSVCKLVSYYFFFFLHANP